jgi:hypothetical protein
VVHVFDLADDPTATRAYAWASPLRGGIPPIKSPMESSAGSNRARARESKMPVKIFVVQGDKSISGLESEINKWQQSLGSKASVTHISTAMTEHQNEAQDWQTRLAVTIWYEL